jgi:hypothetical protein
MKMEHDLIYGSYRVYARVITLSLHHSDNSRKYLFFLKIIGNDDLKVYNSINNQKIC